MVKYNARDLVNMTEDEIWSLPLTLAKVTFDDGTFEVHMRDTIVSWYYWWAHRKWPKVPILLEHHLNGEVATASHNSKMFSKGGWLARTIYSKEEIHPEEIAWGIKLAHNQQSNAITERMETSITSTCILEYMEILDHPRIKEANTFLQNVDFSKQKNIMQAEYLVESTLAKIREVLNDTNELVTNPLVRSARSGLINLEQLIQCVGPRGILADVNSLTFKIPITMGFTEGIYRVADLLKESRCGAQANMFTKEPLQETETFNREMQINAATLCTLHRDEDCGNTEYLPWQVTRKNYKDLIGINYVLNNDDKVLKTFTENSQETIGMTILLRTTMTCKHPNENGICGKCFGELQDNIPEHTNIAHVSNVELNSKMSQNTMSLKHLIRSAILGSLKLSKEQAIHLKLMNEPMTLGINETFKNKDLMLLVSREGVLGLADINLVNDIKRLPLDKVSRLNEVTFSYDDDGDVMYDPVAVSFGSKVASFTVEFLTYIKKVGYEIKSDRSIEIPMKDWDYNLPVWVLPRKHTNVLDLLGEVKTSIKNSGKKIDKIKMDLSETDNLVTALHELYDLVNSKFSINLTHLATTLRATLIRSSEDNDYRIPGNGTTREFGNYRKIIQNRSLAALAAYQEHTSAFTSMKSYLYRDRPPHPNDEIIM